MEPANNLKTTNLQHLADQQRRAAAAELQRARVVEWATAYTPARFFANRGLFQTPFDRAMAGRFLRRI